MLTNPRAKTRWIRFAGYSAAVMVLLALACEAPTPAHAVGPTVDGVVSAGPSSPIFILDGNRMPAGQGMGRLDPSSIDRIEVLKGAAAVKQYGEDGRAGVIEIYTKQGSWSARAPR
jgi:hypothetical protein